MPTEPRVVEWATEFFRIFSTTFSYKLERRKGFFSPLRFSPFLVEALARRSLRDIKLLLTSRRGEGGEDELKRNGASQ